MRIYKYLDKKGAIKTIENQSVLLRTPLEYNDPFDSIFFINKEEMNRAYNLYLNYEIFKKSYNDLIIEKKKPTLIGLVTKKNIELDLQTIRKTKRYTKKAYISMAHNYVVNAQKINESALKDGFEARMSVVMDTIRSLALVSCFGSTPDSILMWSHYANNHNGACLEFEIDDKSFRKVEYFDKFNPFQLTDVLEILFGHELAKTYVDTEDPKYQFLLDPIFSKSRIWEYEGEVRCVFSKNKLDPNISVIEDKKGQHFLLKMPAIKTIYLGCNAKPCFERKIYKIAGNIPIKKIKMSKTEYKLELPE